MFSVDQMLEYVLTQGQATVFGLNPACCLCLQIKLNWKTTVPIYLHISSSVFFFNSVTLELSRCDKGHIVHKAYNANFLSLYRNYLLILILNYVPQVTTYVTLCKQCNLLDMHNKFVM